MGMYDNRPTFQVAEQSSHGRVGSPIPDTRSGSPQSAGVRANRILVEESNLDFRCFQKIRSRADRRQQMHIVTAVSQSDRATESNLARPSLDIGKVIDDDNR